MFGFEGIILLIEKWRFTPNSIFLDSSMVEHSAVNRVVVGSSPTRGVLWTLKVSTKKEYMAPWSSGQDIALSRR